MNGQAALKVSKGDKVIILAYTGMEIEAAKKFKPQIIFPKEDNSI